MPLLRFQMLWKALKLLQSTNYEAVITDLRLPRMDGMDFLREIKKHLLKQLLLS